MAVLNDRFEFDIEGASYDDLIIAAREKGKALFGGEVRFDFSLSVTEAPNLKDWYQAHVIAVTT